MKNIVAALVGLLVCASAFAEAPELKNMMPNSWKKLTRLSEAEERAFVSQGEGKKSMDEFKKEYYWKKFFDFRIYRETVCGIDFYRLLICSGKFETFLAQTYGDKLLGDDRESAEYAKFDEMAYTKTGQIVFVRGKDNAWKEICNMPIREHNVIEPISTPWTDNFVFYDLMIRKLNEREIGFFTTKAGIGICVGNGEPVKITDPNFEGISPWTSNGGAFGAYYNKIKGQLAGSCTTYFTKRNVDGEISRVSSKDIITIDASSYLFDPKCPLRYSIQNAFDGDPATSYVENTEDDLMLIEIGVSGDISRLAVINGYASSKYYYMANNRVRGLSGGIDFADNNMRYQIIKCFGNYLQFDSIYKGELYNDTCLAELNLFVDNKWLFGDINE